MKRWTWVAAVAICSLAGCGGEEDDEITGVCLYDDGAGHNTCRNLWNDDETCPDAGATVGTYDPGTSCEGAGFAYPCTADSPVSLWVADVAECVEWGE
jgi:hypothetical protein